MAFQDQAYGSNLRMCCVCSYSVMSDSSQPHEFQPARLLSLRDFPGKNTGLGCHFLLQGILPTQKSNLCLMISCTAADDTLPLRYWGSWATLEGACQLLSRAPKLGMLPKVKYRQSYTLLLFFFFFNFIPFHSLFIFFSFCSPDQKILINLFASSLILPSA